MTEITSKLIKTDVTFVKIYNQNVICGIGGYLHIFDLYTNELIHKENIFEGLKINCVSINENSQYLLCTGENVIKTYKVDFNNLHLREIAVKELSDWILDVRWTNSNVTEEIVTVLMHNTVNFSSHSLQPLGESNCEENCILYCAKITFDQTDLIVLAGTVFSEILIWKPDPKFRVCSVLKRLCGHTGVLFSIDHDPLQKIIASTSDDRSVILWKYEGEMMDKETKFDSEKLFGHKARCFRSKIIKQCVISTGEDGIINVWNLDGTLRRSMEAHQGGSIWSIDADHERNILVTGGADSGITVFTIEPKVTKSNLPKLDDVPKKVGILENNDITVITENGRFYWYKRSNNIGDSIMGKWILVKEHNDLRSYCLLEVSPCKKQVALAGYYGNIYIYKLMTNSLELICSMKTKSLTRIYALHWLNCDTFLTCESEGLLYLRRKHQFEPLLLLLAVFQLPVLKERWSTCATICSGSSGGIVVGDRKGNIHFYKFHSFEPIQTIKRAHNYLGVTAVSFKDGIATSLGRDSTVRKYKLEEKLTLISQDKLPFSWPISLDSFGLLTAFSGKNIVFCNYKTRRVILEMDCGGGHRSTSLNKTKRQLNFTYIKDALVNEIMFTWESVCARDLVEGTNSDEINALKCVTVDDGVNFLSGGEDTTLRLSHLNWEKNCLKQRAVLKSHLSSVRCLHLHKVERGQWYLFSAGGRAQIVTWKIIGSECVQLHSYYERLKDDESEIRVMDLFTVYRNKELLLLAACSDGKVKVYSVYNNGISYSHCIQYSLKCILKLTAIYENSLFELHENDTHKEFDNFTNDRCLLITMATDGLLVFWDFDNYEKPVYTLRAHQSGINSYSCMRLCKNTYLILTGGDDNTLTLTEFTVLENPLEIIYNRMCSNSNAHCAQITGVYLSRKDYLLSVGLDKRLLIFKYKTTVESFELFCVGAYETSISDVKGMEVFDSKCSFKIILYGLGVEVLNVMKCS